MNNINNLIELLNSNPTIFLASNPGSTIAKSLIWLINVGGFFMALWGVLQVAQSGRANDGAGKSEGSWLIGGGLAIMGLASGALIIGIFDNIPGM